jgi:hypothetical protein
VVTLLYQEALMKRLRTLVMSTAVTGVLAATAGCAVTTAPAGTAAPATARTITATPVAAAAASRAAASFAAPVDVTAVAFPGSATLSGSAALSGSATLLGSGTDGWALGTAGATATEAGTTTIWHTSTAGASWQVQWRGSGTPMELTASDPSHAWALLGCGSGNCDRRLLATTDGGAHWRQIATLPDAAGTVTFGNPYVGVATAMNACSYDLNAEQCPTKVLVSKDGGAHWTTVLSSHGMAWATEASTGKVWVALNLAGKASRIEFLTGLSQGWWKLGVLTVQPGWPLSAGSRVTMAVGQHGLEAATVFDLESCAMHGCGVANVYQTGDGGQTWHAAAVPVSGPQYCGAGSVALSLAADGTTWAAFGFNGAACDPPLGVLYLDRQQGWQALAPWQLSAPAALDAISADTAYAVSDTGALSRTTDNGQHWTQVLPAPEPQGSLAAIRTDGVTQSDEVIGAQDAGDAGAIVRDDGYGWQQVADLPGIITSISDTASQLYAVAYVPGNSVSGDSGPTWRMWASTDGGSTWMPAGPLPGGANTVIAGPWLTSDGHGLLLTYTGDAWVPQSGGNGPATEWLTTDGGASWHKSAVLFSTSTTLSGAASFAYQPGTGWTGWIGTEGTSGLTRVFTVSATGHLSVLPGLPEPAGLQLTGPGSGFEWVVNYNRNGLDPALALYRTADGGAHWQQVTKAMSLPAATQGATVPLITFADQDHGWLVYGQTTLYTADGGQEWFTQAPGTLR